MVVYKVAQGGEGTDWDAVGNGAMTFAGGAMATVGGVAARLTCVGTPSQKRTSYDVTTVYIDRLEDGEFEIKKEHLIKLCDDTILKKLSLTDLNTIGFAFMTSEYFHWDTTN
jgi:hypothetical protein